MGLLAGREFALSMPLAEVNKYRTSRHVSKDAMKLMFGLVISLLLATELPSYINTFQVEISAKRLVKAEKKRA